MPPICPTPQEAGATLNLAVQVGHGTVQACVLGLQDRVPDGEELERMKGLLAESLDAGAMGFSTRLFYAPGSYARLDEVIALAEVAARHRKVYSTHMHDEGNHSVGLFVALNAHFVRERKLVLLTEAVRKMTLLPASRLGLTRRGRVATGFAADLVAFNRIRSRIPLPYPVGIPHVAVNGVMVIENGQFTGLTPGKVIRDFGD